MTGSVRQEGQLVTLSNGIYFFDNSGSVSAYNTASETWETGSSATTSFRSLQDSSVSGFDSETNTLWAVSDNNQNVYLSYDYSTNAMIKFNGLDLTFSLLPSRPVGTQWACGLY